MNEQNNIDLERQLDSLANEFEANWKPDQRPDFDTFLSQIDKQNRDQLLKLLLEVDIEMRVDVDLAPVELVGIVFTENAKGAAIEGGPAEPFLSCCACREELLADQGFSQPAITTEHGHDAPRYEPFD